MLTVISLMQLNAGPVKQGMLHSAIMPASFPQHAFCSIYWEIACFSHVKVVDSFKILAYSFAILSKQVFKRWLVLGFRKIH